MSLQTFYARGRWGNLWGVRGPKYGPAGHRGHDIKTAPRESIPLLRGGLVVAVKYSSIIGTYVVVQVGKNDFDGYAHLVNVRVNLGLAYPEGYIVGQAATYGDRTGSAWLGPHLHITNGPSIMSVTTGTTYNPAYRINAVLAGTITPTNLAKPYSPAADPMKVDDSMLIIESPGRGQAVIGPDYFVQLNTAEETTQAEHIVSAHLVGNDRQFDLWKIIATGGNG